MRDDQILGFINASNNMFISGLTRHIADLRKQNFHHYCRQFALEKMLFESRIGLLKVVFLQAFYPKLVKKLLQKEYEKVMEMMLKIEKETKPEEKPEKKEGENNGKR